MTEIRLPLRSLLVSLALVVAPAASHSAPREAGSYVLLLDGDGLAIAGGYWLSPDVMVAIKRDEYGTGHAHLVDRAFFPQRDSDPLVLTFDRFETVPDPNKLIETNQFAFGNPVPLHIRRDSEAFGNIPANVLETDAVLEMSEAMPIGLDTGTVMAHRYSLQQTVNVFASADGEGRVYFPELGLDVDRDAADLARRVEFGQASSSRDFENLFTLRANPPSDVMTCIATLRASAPYKAASDEYRMLADAWTAGNFGRTGFDYMTAKGATPSMEVLSPKC